MILFNKYQNTDINFDNLRELSEERFHTANLLMQEQIANEEIKQILQKVKAEKISTAGTSYCVRCPNCNKLIILSNELNTGQGICNKCYTVFLIDIG